MTSADGSEFKSGVMVALRVPNPESYALPGGLPAEDLHVTLAYLGEAGDLPPGADEAIKAAVRAACQSGQPIPATFPAEYGVFENPDEVPFWAKPDGPEIFTFRDSVVNQLSARGLGEKISTKHPFNPHVTLKYLDGESERIPEGFSPAEPQPITFTEVLVSIGEDEEIMRLEKPSVTASAQKRRRRVQISTQTEQSLRRMVELYNRTPHRGPLASLEMVKAVYSRGAASSELQTGASRHAIGISRVSDFLDYMGRGDEACQDSDLFPRPPKPSPIIAAARVAQEQKLDLVADLLTEAAVIPRSDPKYVFQLNRALALTASSSPRARTVLEPKIRALVADGNSRIARSLRARRQLRDRYGRWIEMGRGVRFKVRQPGAPGGGTWHHGRVEGIDVPNGRVDVRLEDGRLVKVPNDKLEQPKALLNLPGRPVVPATDPENLDPDAPAVARLEEVDAPTNRTDGPRADSIDVAEGIEDARRELEARVTDSSSERRARDQATAAAADIMDRWQAEEISEEDALAELNDVANFADARGSSAEGLSDEEREAFRSYAEDLQDMIAAAQGDDELEESVPEESTPTPIPRPGTPEAEEFFRPGTEERQQREREEWERMTPAQRENLRNPGLIRGEQAADPLQPIRDIAADLEDIESEDYGNIGRGVSQILDLHEDGEITDEQMLDQLREAAQAMGDVPDDMGDLDIDRKQQRLTDAIDVLDRQINNQVPDTDERPQPPTPDEAPEAEAEEPDELMPPDPSRLLDLAADAEQMADENEGAVEVGDRLRAIANTVGNGAQDFENGNLPGDELVRALDGVDQVFNGMRMDTVAGKEIDDNPDLGDALDDLQNDIALYRRDLQNWIDTPDAEAAPDEEPEVTPDVEAEVGDEIEAAKVQAFDALRDAVANVNDFPEPDYEEGQGGGVEGVPEEVNRALGDFQNNVNEALTDYERGAMSAEDFSRIAYAEVEKAVNAMAPHVDDIAIADDWMGNVHQALRDFDAANGIEPPGPARPSPSDDPWADVRNVDDLRRPETPEAPGPVLNAGEEYEVQLRDEDFRGGEDNQDTREIAERYGLERDEENRTMSGPAEAMERMLREEFGWDDAQIRERAHTTQGDGEDPWAGVEEPVPFSRPLAMGELEEIGDMIDELRDENPIVNAAADMFLNMREAAQRGDDFNWQEAADAANGVALAMELGRGFIDDDDVLARHNRLIEDLRAFANNAFDGPSEEGEALPEEAPEVPESPESPAGNVDVNGNPVPEGLDLQGERQVRGETVQTYRQTRQEGDSRLDVSFDVGSRGIVVRGMFGPRDVANARTWDEALQKAEEIRAEYQRIRGEDQGRRDEEARRRADAERAEAERLDALRANHERRVQENVDDFDRPLPQGWSRDITADGTTMYRGPGNYILTNDPSGSGALIALRREGGQFVRLGDAFPNWDDALAFVDRDRNDRQLDHRASFSDFMEANGFDSPAIDAVRFNRDALDVQREVENDPAYRRIMDAANDAEGADLRNPDQRRAVERADQLRNFIRNITDLREPEMPEPAEGGGWNLGEQAEQFIDNLPIDNDQVAAIRDMVAGMTDSIAEYSQDDRIILAQEIRDVMAGPDGDGLSMEDRDQLNRLANAIEGDLQPPESPTSPEGGAPAEPAPEPDVPPVPEAPETPEPEAPAAEEPQPDPLPQVPRPPRPANPPANPARYDRNGVIQDRNGNEVYVGLRVRAVRDGQEGVVVAVQQQPPYARIEWPDGRRQVRAGRQLIQVDPRPAAPAAPARPAQPAPEAPAAPPAPEMPAAVDNAGIADNFQAIVDLHRAGAIQGWPLIPEIGGARSLMERGAVAARAGDIDGARAFLDQAIQNYNDGMPAVQRIGGEYAQNVALRLDLANQLRDQLSGMGAGAVAQELRDLRAQIPARLGRADRRQRAVWQAGFALERDAIPAIEAGRIQEARGHLDRAINRLEQGGRRDLADQVRAMSNRLGGPGQNEQQPEAPAAPGQTSPNTPIEPADFIENRFSGERAPVAAESFDTPGVRDPRLAEGADLAVEPLRLDAEQRDYGAWGTRAAEIAGAARSRPAAAQMFGMSGVDLENAARAAFGATEGVTFGDGYTLRMSGVSKLQDGNAISVSLLIYDKDGNHVGQSQRVIYNENGKMRAYNSLMELNGTSRGGGFATSFNRYMENWYIANGFSKVEVSAGLSHGGFVWAMNGFGWKGGADAKKQRALGFLQSAQRRASSPSEQAQVAHMMRRANAGDVPTPMEIALIGWRPGLKGSDNWLGKQVLMGSGWSGVKELKPTNVNWQQRQGYDFAKRAGDRVRQNMNRVQAVSEELEANVREGFPDLRLKNEERNHLAALLQRNGSIAELSPRAKRRIAQWAGDRLIDGNTSDYQGMREDLLMLRNAAMNDLNADYPTLNNLGVGEPLRRLTIQDLQGNQVPGFTIRRLGGQDAGVNATWEVTHNASGQVFYMKNDTYGARFVGGDESISRNAEYDANRLFREVGVNGVNAYLPSEVEPALVVMARGGDNLDFVSRPKNFARLSGSAKREVLNNLANPEDALNMFLFDVAAGNGDRHDNNFQVAKDRDGRWWVIPVDQGLAGAGNGWRGLDQYSVQQRIQNLVLPRNELYGTALRNWKRQSPETFRAMLEDRVRRYRDAIRRGGWADPNFQDRLSGSLDEIANNIDLVVNAL